jgi:hypothetical protein
MNLTSKGSYAVNIFTNSYGNQQFAVAHTASAVNYLQVTGGVTTIAPTLQAVGSDTNVNMTLSTKGTGNFTFYSANAYPQFVVANTTSAANYLQVSGGIAGDSPYISAQGTNADISIKYFAKGVGGHYFYNSLGYAQFAVSPTASAVNYLQVSGGDGITSSPTLQAAGSSTDVTMQLLSKGSGELQFFTNSGVKQFVVAHTPSAVNYLQVTGSANSGTVNFGSPLVISSQGSDNNVAIQLISKGISPISFATNASPTTIQFLIAHKASAISYLQVTGSASTTPTLSAQGSGGDVDIVLAPKGAGLLSFGTYTAGIIAQAGYITIKDTGGTTRRLLVG